jgi:hypothetical protein
MSIDTGADAFEKNKRLISGNLSYSEVILGIVDILGFKSYIAKEDKESLNKLVRTICFEKIKKETYQPNTHFSLLSDTFIAYTESINYQGLYEIITALENIRIGLIENGLFVRGAIVTGNHFMQDDIMVSPAFINAHTIEEQICVYPRIVIDNELLKRLSIGNETRPQESELYSWITKDIDACHILFPFVGIDVFSLYLYDGYSMNSKDTISKPEQDEQKTVFLKSSRALSPKYMME